jgi:hypothetical protein
LSLLASDDDDACEKAGLTDLEYCDTIGWKAKGVKMSRRQSEDEKLGRQIQRAARRLNDLLARADSIANVDAQVTVEGGKVAVDIDVTTTMKFES